MNVVSVSSAPQYYSGSNDLAAALPPFVDTTRGSELVASGPL